MSAAPSEERSHDGASQTCGKDIKTPGSMVKKKEVTLPPLCPEKCPLSAAYVFRPLFSHAPGDVPSDRLVSVVKLPRLIGQVGPRRTIADTKWTEGPRLMASALGTDIPIRTVDESTTQSLTGKDESIKATCKDKKITTVKNEKKNKSNKTALTATEVLYIFATKIDLGGLYYLKEVDGDSYRPYDLRVVDPTEAGSEHYIFSPNTVRHVTERGYGGHVSLAEWHRESVMWTALQEIPFFKNFRLRRAFSWWHRNVRKIIFQRKCKDLQDMLLIAVPQFRNALFLFTRIIEELKATHQLPQDDSKTYTLLEFKNVLIAMNQKCLRILEKLSQSRSVILNGVKEGSYKAHKELQMHMEYAEKPNKYEPIHLHQAHQRELKKKLAQSGRVLQKLGNFAALINQMIVQSLVTIVRQDLISFLNNVLKRKESQQCSLFHTELCFSAISQLAVDPPTHLFEEAVSEALLSVADSVIQMCDTCGFFLEISSSVSSSGFAQDLTSDSSFMEHPTITGENKNNDGLTGSTKFCCWRWRRHLSSQGLVPKQTSLMVQGNKVHGCYNLLSKRQLEWQISVNDVTKQVEKEQAKIMQEAEVEILQLCESYSWLVDIHSFIDQWSQVSLESMKGQPAVLYEEHIRKVRHWATRINTVPSSISTSNQLFIIQCTSIKDNLGQQLSNIEDQVLDHLVEQIKLRSESLMSDLEVATAELKTEPRDLRDFSLYARKVRESVKMLADTQKSLEYIHSLQDIIFMNYRKMTEPEVTLEKKMLTMRDCFIPLLKQADSIVCHRLPSMAKALDTMFSSVVSALKNNVSKATSGPFLDPTQDAKELVLRLNCMCTLVHNLSAQLEELSMNSQNLRENPLDLTILTTDVQKIKARKELWELIAVYTTWMEEWKELLFSEVVVSQAQEKIAKWKEQALSLTSIIPTHDAVLQETLGILERLSHQLAVMAMLQNSTLKHKHWKDIFQGMGHLYVPEKDVTVAELMCQQLEVNQKLITKICRDSQAECNMKQTFQKLQQGWEARLFQLEKFTLPAWQHREPQHGLTETEKPRQDTNLNLQTASQHSCNDARFTIVCLEIHFAEIDSDLMTLSTMLKSPHSVDLKLQMEYWVRSLQELERLLYLFERYQQIWTFLTKMFHETSFSVQRVDLLEQFQPVDETFKEMIHSLSSDPCVLNFVHSKRENDRFHGNSLCQILIDGLSTMEAISNQMVDLLDIVREQFPRLWFLSDRDVIQLLSLHPTPFTLQPFVRKCFKGVHLLEVDCEIPSNTRDVKSCEATSQSYRQMKVLGFFGGIQEHITFSSPLEPNLSTLVWLGAFEKKLKVTMVQLMKQCAVVRNKIEPSSKDLECDKKVRDTLLRIADRGKTVQTVLDLLSEFPLQCLLVAEEAVWCSTLLEAFQESSPVKLSSIKAHNSAKLENLGHSIRDGVTGAERESLVSKYMMMCLRALVQLTMNHGQQLSRLMEIQDVPLESSFEWLSLMKYHINSEDLSRIGNDDPTCYVDVLGHRLQYDYEYFGPEDWDMVHTPSTDRAMLGILFALTSYRCGFVSGPSMSGKKKTVVQLGKALGRQVVNVRCCPSIRPGDVQRMLLGALQTGAWLLLDSVDLLTQGVLSLLGEHLLDIHQSLSVATRNKHHRVNEEAKDTTADEVTVCKRTVDSECQMALAGKSFSANLNYGCVLISSKGYTSEVPESLRYATRPIAITHPDYRIIAEVMLTSIGFSEAMSLSQHLVSLISLAKDSCCLPDFIADDQRSYLVILKKIISASEIHLQQSVRQRQITDEGKGLAAEQTDLTPSQNVTTKVVMKDGRETEKSSRLRSFHLSVIQGLMEETAIVKAILSVLLPAFHEHKKASQFHTIFKDTLPTACQFPFFQQYTEEEEKKQLKDAVTEELQGKWFHSDSEIISHALTLHQNMKFSQAVMLIGPSGSGKTTCYCALAGALNRLAAKEVEHVSENVNMIKGDIPKNEPQTSASAWNSVDTVVLFPNAMCHEEVFGFFCEKRGWQDGAVTKVLRDLGRHEPTSSPVYNDKESDHTPKMKWLVMDGKPVGHPGWLDYLTTLCSPEDPLLYLPTCETLPSQSHLKLLMEITDLCDASPSAVTRCSLVCFTGTDLWKAVWKSEMDALSFEQKFDQGTLKMFSRLAEDLFSSTLKLLRQKSLTSAIHNEGESCKSLIYGLQEITSFVRILRALLQRFGKEVEKAVAIRQRDKTGTADIDSYIKPDLLSRNLFLVAYIWGFSGHLNPRYWPQFDLLARELLFTCRYKIVVPDEESVFDHFFNIDSKIYPRNTLLNNAITPKYSRYTYLLNLMLEANQPVLLAGEPGSGKTTLCKTLLTFDKRHISLPASPLLSSRDFRTILNSVNCQKSCEDTRGPIAKQFRLLLFVDDLHEAPCDVFGKTSAALETLRQSISKGEILTFDNYHFKLLSSGSINYVATCCVVGSGNHCSNVISTRLSRLFCIFVLPSLSLDVLFSMHSPRLIVWLKEMPLKQSGEDMARCIITATRNLYHAVCEKFPPTMQRPYFIFSHHDLQKVFLGMRLWQPNIPNMETLQKKENSLRGFPPVLPGPAASLLNIGHLWMHECMRTFSDRLCSEDESKTLVSLIAKTATTHYGISLVDEAQLVSLDDPPSLTRLAIHRLPADGTCEPIVESLNLPGEPTPYTQSDLKTLTKPSLLSENSHSEETSLKTHSQILQHMEGIMAELVYGPDLSEALKSMNQQHNFKHSYSYQNQDLDALQQELCALIDRKEEDEGQKVDNDYNITTRYIVHKQRASQLLHILRVLLIPGGHGVLIGSDRGTGRKTNVRLAACLMGYQLMEVHPGNENNLHEILKEAGNQARDGIVIILVHEGISQSVRDKLLVAMAHRTYPGLYTEEEMRDLVSRVTAVKNSRRYLMDKRDQMFEKYLSRIHRNVHVFLLLPFTMSDSSEMPANSGIHGGNAQLTKALSSSCCVEVYQPWSNQSLVEAAAQCLSASPHKMERKGSEAGLSVVMAGIHQSACQYASVLLRTQPFSPQTYTEFIAHFGYLCKHLHKQQQSQADRLASVLSHLDGINNTTVEYKPVLIRLQETQQHERELLRAVDHHTGLLEKAQDTCAIEENKLHHLEEQINQTHEQVRSVFSLRLKILNCLNPCDLEEVRHYRDPPDGVVKIMDAICLLFNRPPGWENAKQLLGQANFFQELESFDCCRLTKEQLQQLGQIVHSPQFVPESVRDVSKACESLCRWVQAVYECCCMQHQLLVNQQLGVLAKEARDQLHLAKQRKEDAHFRLQDVRFQLLLVRKELEEQLLELHTTESSEREDITALRQLEAHVKGWKATAQGTELNNQTIPGDALILAAIISYLGPFGPDMRTELLSKWRELCQTGSININPKDPRTTLFTHSDAAPSYPPLGFPIPVSERLQLPLGRALGMRQDTPSARMVEKLLLWGCRRAWVQCWPLLADTQQHLDMSAESCLITGGNAQLECGMVVCADDPELLDKLDQAAEKGLRVLVTRVEHAIPSPQFLARLARPAGRCFPGLKQHAKPTHPEFFIFFSSHLPVQLLSSEIHPSILDQVCVVDLSLSSEEIQELMLTQLLQSSEYKGLLIQSSQLQNYKQLLQEKLVSEEDALMDYIVRSNTSPLLDSDLLSRVAACQDAMTKLQAEIQQLSEELEHHKSLLAVPRHLMRLAAALYQALQEVSRLSPAYYFSLHGFITVMQEAFVVKGRPLVSYRTGKVSGSVIPEVTNRMVAQLLTQYRPCLLKSHVTVLRLLVSVALLQHNQHCSEAERVAFLRGLQDMKPRSPPLTVSQATGALPSWISPHIHPELLCLENIPVFRGLIASLSTCPTQWQEYLHLPSSTVTGAVPCRSHSHLSLLQRALLWKTILPNCLDGLDEAMAVYNPCLPGHTAETPHTGNPEALSRYLVKHEGPIIITLPSPRGDKWTSIQPLHLINRLSRCVAETKQVQVKVISFGALCDREVILSMLDKAVNDGHWLIFNNCHLLEEWDNKVVAHLSQLMAYFTEERRLPHPCFRLWFITQEHTPCSIPAAVRMCALPLICDSPWDLKEELSCSLREVVSIIQCQSDVTADNTELLLRCANYHSVLLQRQSYKYLGQGRIYSWSQEDLLALVKGLISIASLCHDKTKALHYIAVNLVHGGHVLDSADLEVMESVAKTCLSKVSPLLGSGPHILSNIITNPGHFDLSGLLQILEQGLQDTANISDPLLLGFSEDVAAEILKLNNHNLNILLQASQTPIGTVRSLCTQLNPDTTLPSYSHARDRLQALKSHLAHKSDSIDTNAGAVSLSPLRDFLQAEWDDLIDLVSSLLSLLQQPVQYRPTFASLLKLADLSRLERRAELLSAYLWQNNTSDPPGAYRLSAFKNARGFLAAVMRKAAQVNRKYISDITLHFQVVSDSTFLASVPLDAVYLCGLELRGASWDMQLGALQDTASLQPCPLPLVCVRAHVRNTNTARETFPCKSSPLKDANNVQLALGSPSLEPQLPLYHCPLYLDGEQESGNWGLADVNIITKFPLHAKLNPVLCSLRRVMLVSMI